MPCFTAIAWRGAQLWGLKPGPPAAGRLAASFSNAEDATAPCSTCGYLKPCLMPACRRIEQPGLACTEALVADAITRALQRLFGCIGGAVLFEVIDCESATGVSTIAVDSRRACCSAIVRHAQRCHCMPMPLPVCVQSANRTSLANVKVSMQGRVEGAGCGSVSDLLQQICGKRPSEDNSKWMLRILGMRWCILQLLLSPVRPFAVLQVLSIGEGIGSHGPL